MTKQANDKGDNKMENSIQKQINGKFLAKTEYEEKEFAILKNAQKWLEKKLETYKTFTPICKKDKNGNILELDPNYEIVVEHPSDKNPDGICAFRKISND